MAFSSDLKVVKVGDIVAPPEEPGFLWPDTSTPESTEIALDQLTHRSSIQHPIYSGGWTHYHSHEHDLVKPVIKNVELPPEGGAPDNWPQIPQLARRRSCEASGERTHCVNKAVEHLQLLQDILTDWVERTAEKVSMREANADKKLPICDSDSENKEVGLVPSTTDAADEKLAICYTDPENKAELVPLETAVRPSISVRALKNYNSHDELKSVVNEVMILLAWLHDDCQKTEAKLNDEKVLESQLSLQIDQMSRQKIVDISAAVQEEHELFKQRNRMDLITLTYLTRICANFHAKLKSLKNLNFHLKKDIAFSNEQIPLLQDKILLENKHIDKLRGDLAKQNQVLSETVMNTAETNHKHKESEKVCKQELRLIDRQLNDICTELNQLSKAGEKAEKRYYDMCQGIVDGQKKVTENEKDITVLKVKSDNQKAKINAKKLMNKNKKDNLMCKFKETKEMKDKNRDLEEQLEEKSSNYKKKVVQISDDILRLEKELKSLIEFNKEKTQSIASIRLAIEESKKQKDFYEKGLKRLSREIMKHDNQISVTLAELGRMNELNRFLKEQIDEHHQKNVDLEKSFQSAVEALKREVQAENKYYMRMMHNMNELEMELRIERAAATEEKDKILSQISELTRHLQNMEEKFERLTVLKKQKEQTLINLRKKMNDAEEYYTKTIDHSDEYLVLLSPYLIEAKEISEKLKKKMENMMGEKERMESEVKIMVEQSTALQALVAKMEVEMVKLREQMDELNIKSETISKYSKSTRIRYNQVLTRVNKEKYDHDSLMRSRRETLQEILQKKKQSLEDNEELATRYRVSQSALSQRREGYVKLSEDTLMLKQTLKDFKQLVNLQTKMQYNSKSYCEYRGLYNSQQLAYIVNTSENNIFKITELRNEYESKIEAMTNNLKKSMSSLLRQKPNALPKIVQTTS